MVVSTSALLRSAGYAAFLVAGVQVASALALWLFFGGAGEIFGPVNDLLVAVSLVLLVLPVLGIRALVGRRAGRWFDVLGTLALGGLAIAAAGQILLVLGAISLETSFVTGTVGILPVLAWVLGVGLAARRTDALPNRLGVVTAAVLLLAAALAIGSSALPAIAVTILAGALVIALAGWLVIVGSTCLAAGRSAATALAREKA